eukprot:UN01553
MPLLIHVIFQVFLEYLEVDLLDLTVFSLFLLWLVIIFIHNLVVSFVITTTFSLLFRLFVFFGRKVFL